MKTHAALSDMAPDEVSVFRGNFVYKLKEREQGVEGALRVVESNLTVIDPASAEYALALTALVSRENDTMRSHFAHLMRFISEIRPASTGGRMATGNVPEKFKGMWPHERLGHKTWKAFVEASPAGELDPETRQFKTPPGLGWSQVYETNLSKGYAKLRTLVERAMPDAAPEERAAKLDEVAGGAGPTVVHDIGGMSKVMSTHNFSNDEASVAVETLASGEVTQEDIRTRGALALTSPAKPARDPAKAIARVLNALAEPDDRIGAIVAAVRRMSAEDRAALRDALMPILRLEEP